MRNRLGIMYHVCLSRLKMDVDAQETGAFSMGVEPK